MRIKTSDTEKLLSLKENLSKKIIGQDYAINKLSNAILRKRANITSSKRPPSFIFVGPTGVGKTALVKALAYELFDNEDAVIKLIEVSNHERKPVSHTFTDKNGEFVFGPLCPDKEYELQIWVDRVKHIKICTDCKHHGKCLKGVKLDCPHHEYKTDFKPDCEPCK